MPSGGQFAPHRRQESPVGLNDDLADLTSGDLTSPPPDWSSLDDEFDDIIHDGWPWAGYEFPETGALEMLDISEAQAAAKYGPARARWLAEVTFSGSENGQWVTMDGGPGFEMDLEVVYDDDAERFSVEGLPALSDMCPVDGDGNQIFDLEDPAWDNVKEPSSWVLSGVRDPATALRWEKAGHRWVKARHWIAQGLDVDDVASLDDPAGVATA